MTVSSVAQRWVSSLMGPSIPAIVLALIVAFSLPLLLHLFLYRSTTEKSVPTVLLVGPSGSGKTTFLTQLERGNYAATHTSQTPLTVEASLPVSLDAASSKYRSVNDPTLQTHRRFYIVDTPGHGKLRYYAFDRVNAPANLSGIIFMVDAADLSRDVHEGSSQAGLGQTAAYLHEILLLLQKRSTNSTTSRTPKEIPVLIAANKQDLFTALPTPLVKSTLEAEITKIRDSRSKGLLESGVGLGDATDVGEDKDWLGDVNESRFNFIQLAEANVPVDIAGGHALGPDGADVTQWRDWIASKL